MTTDEWIEGARSRARRVAESRETARRAQQDHQEAVANLTIFCLECPPDEPPRSLMRPEAAAFHDEKVSRERFARRDIDAASAGALAHRSCPSHPEPVASCPLCRGEKAPSRAELEELRERLADFNATPGAPLGTARPVWLLPPPGSSARPGDPVE